MITVNIQDKKNNNNLIITDEGVIPVVLHNHPPLEDSVFTLPFMSAFVDENGSNDMAINGSSNSVRFSVNAVDSYNIFIKYISIEIGDGGSPSLNKFGALGSLTNGVSWLWNTQAQGDYFLHDGIKTNKQFIRIGGDTHSIGTGVDAFLADVSGGGTEKSYMPNIDVAETFGMPYGLRLRKGTKDNLTFVVNDNLSGLTTSDIVAYGSRI